MNRRLREGSGEILNIEALCLWAFDEGRSKLCNIQVLCVLRLKYVVRDPVSRFGHDHL